MHILVVDDEPLARQRMLKMLSSIEGNVIVGEADNGENALAAVEGLDPDLVFMDVKMPGMDGLEAARVIAQLDDPPAIIFCTAFDEYALDAFDAQAVGYIVKPFTHEELVKAIDKASRVNKLQRASVSRGATDEVSDTSLEKRRHISVKTRKGIELIPLDDIHYFVADQKYVTVMYEHGEALIDETLKELENDLDDTFIRVHRNALVAIQDICGLEKSDIGHFEVLLKRCDYRPMVSRRHLTSVKALLNSL